MGGSKYAERDRLGVIEFRRAMRDVVWDYLETRCEVQDGVYTQIGELYDDYVSWCGCEQRVGKQQFGQCVATLGFEKARREHGRVRVWLGIKIRI